jgi:hypothetical protein
MGRNPILKLDVNIFWSFSKYVLKMITFTSDMWSKYPGLWWKVYDMPHSAILTHVRWSVNFSALPITWFTLWGDGLQRRYASDVAFCIICFPLTVDNSDMN